MENKVDKVLFNVRKRFLQRLAALVSRYTIFIELLRKGEVKQSVIDDTYTQIHKTAGTASAFGFMELSEQSLALEIHLEALSEGKNVDEHTKIILDNFDNYLSEIKRLVSKHLDINLDERT